MTTQRDRLAALIHGRCEAEWGDRDDGITRHGVDAHDELVRHLYVHGVRVVDVETLAAAFHDSRTMCGKRWRSCWAENPAHADDAQAVFDAIDRAD